MGETPSPPCLRDVLLDHALDLRGADPTLEAGDGSLLLDEDERRHDLDAELLRELGLGVDVDARDAEPSALLACQVRDQALHTARRAGRRRAEEDQNRSRV